MRNYLTNMLVAGLITFGSIFAFSKEAKSLDSIVENSAAQKVENVAAVTKPINPINPEPKTGNIPVEKSRLKELKLNGGGNFNEVSNQGYFGSVVKLNNNLELGLSYERVDGKNSNAKNKDKSLLIANIEYKNWKNAVFGMSYNSDNKVGFYSTLFKGGFKKQILKALYVEGFIGLKVGRINLSSEKEDVLGGMIKYHENYAKGKIALNLQLSGHMPRKYLKESVMKSPWTGDFIGSLTFPITNDVSIGGEYKISRDYLRGLGVILRKGVSIKFIYNRNQKENKN